MHHDVQYSTSGFQIRKHKTLCTCTKHIHPPYHGLLGRPSPLPRLFPISFRVNWFPFKLSDNLIDMVAELRPNVMWRPSGSG